MANIFPSRWHQLLFALLVLLAGLNARSFGQGNLTPPGAPAPTMKSLDQMEARTPITNTSSTFTITQPGSYYQTHNPTAPTGDGIDNYAADVTLDLNGFTIASTAPVATGYGIADFNAASNLDPYGAQGPHQRRGDQCWRCLQRTGV